MNKKFIALVLMCLSQLSLLTIAMAEESRIYQADTTGNIQYHKPSAVIQENGRIVQTDSFGNKQYHKQQYQIKGDKVYQTDSAGNIQYHKPHTVIGK